MNKKGKATLQETFREAKVERDKRELNNRIKQLEKENNELRTKIVLMSQKEEKLKTRIRKSEFEFKNIIDYSTKLALKVSRYERNWFVLNFLKSKVERKP